ncbi:MAG: hypothetical protein GY932_03195 [Arcobacter sp.]|nr:hypothetical protein [Arcobacter sp.]
MLKNINIKINGLTEQTSLKVRDSLVEIINQLSFLDLRRFFNIIITSNFERDIESLSSSKKSLFKNRYRTTSNNTYAMVITVPKDDDFELILVIKSEFVKSILKNHKTQSYKNSFHILHHELAHIHDNNNKIDSFKELMKKKSYQGIDSITYPISEICWSEYIANYLSSSSAKDTNYPKSMAKALLIQIKDTQFDVKTQLMAFKINKNRQDLIDNSIEKIKSLLKSASYLLGYLHGLNITLEELDEKINFQLEVSYFFDIYKAIEYEFYSLGNVYPNAFINLNIYRNLSFYIEGFLNQMGIVFYNDNKNNELSLRIIN